MSDHKENEDEEFSAWLKETFRMRGILDSPPSRLYKFLSSESKYFPLALHELMLHSRIFLSSRKDFNDPFDTKFALDIPDSADIIAEFVAGIATRQQNPELSADHLAELSKDPTTFRNRAQQSLESSLDAVGIYSLTDSVSHPLMWAHYGCSHRGIALVFRHALPDTFGAFPIRYQEHYPRSSISKKGIEAFHVLAKGSAWTYENEWRIVESKKARQWLAIEPKIFGGIIFGASASQETYDFVLDLIKRRAGAGLPPIAVYRAQIGESFDLEFYQFVGTEEWRPTILS